MRSCVLLQSVNQVIIIISYQVVVDLSKLCKCKLDSSQLGISGFTFRTVAGEDVLKDPVHSFCPLDPVISPGTGLSLFEHLEVFG